MNGIGTSLKRPEFELQIKPKDGWRSVDLADIWHYRELVPFLIWRDIKIRYRQTSLGVLWAILQPLISTVLLTVVFNRFAGIRSSGSTPYGLFSVSGLVAWTFFANAVSSASNSLIGNQQLVSKIYFPRLFIPIGAIGALALDLLLGIVLAVTLTFFYRWPLTWAIFWTPLFILAILLAAAGLGFLLSALNVTYRDVKYVVPFVLQMGFFVTPVIYPVTYFPKRVQLLIGLNPMAGIVEGFRHSLLGTPVSWGQIGVSFAVTLLIFVGGLFVFERMERRFADVI